MNFEMDPKDSDTSETFSLKPNTKNELVWITSILFSLTELGYADVCECMQTEGFLLNEKVYTALKTAAKTKTLINKVSKHLIKNFNIDGDKEDFSFILEGVFGTIRKCYKVAEEPEIIILISSEKVQDFDEDCCCDKDCCDKDCCDEDDDCCCCGSSCCGEEKKIDPKTLN